MNADTDPDVVLGPGFLGEWRRAASLQRTYEAGPGDDVFGTLAAMARDVPRGGVLAGYVGYEAAAALHGLSLPPPPPFAGRTLPLAWAGLFGETQRMDPPGSEGPDRHGPRGDIQEGENAAAYEAKVAAIVDAILAGDLFQANLSRRLSAVFAGRPDPDALFARLAGGTDAPYAAKISMAGGAVLSASPELFLEVCGDRIVAEPIKGTRPRGETPARDAALAAELAASQKDRAENVMIADLMRNDLSAICADATMREVAICALRTLPRVHHLYSRIEARLRPGIGPFGALGAAFPCGSITGAPKLAAMRTISALEGEGRGPYCGAIFAVTPGRAVFSVLIRTGILTYGATGSAAGGARLDVRTGGGVTVLSVPAEEYAETTDKAYPFSLMVDAVAGTP